jgi:RNA polymerase subunit RPABC4/transcription elongation factor Spt4
MSDFVAEAGVLIRYEGPGSSPMLKSSAYLKSLNRKERLAAIIGMRIDVVIPDGIKFIGSMAFVAADGIESVHIPDGVEVIRTHAFDNCKNLERVHIGSSVREIQEGAFEGCISIRSITLPPSVRTIGPRAFGYCMTLETIHIPASVREIGGAFLNDCTNLRAITVDKNAFYDSDMLASVYIGDIVLKIGGGAYDRCNSRDNAGEGTTGALPPGEAAAPGPAVSGKATACAKCRAPLPEGAAFCPQCGAKVESGPPVCSQCGKELRSEWKVCPFCGTKV